MAQTSEFEGDTPIERLEQHAKRAVAPPPIELHLHQDHKAPGGGPRASKLIKWVNLSETNEEYADHQIRARIRYPETINTEYFNPGSPGRIIDGLRLIVLEHNGWLDPDSDDDTVLPPVDQKCTIDAARDAALKDEETTYAVALKEARTEAARATVEAAHTKAVGKIEADRVRQKEQRPEPCCFWDSVSQEEVILMIRAINAARGKVLGLLLETKTDSPST